MPETSARPALVVDDDADLGELLRLLLAERGFEVRVCGSGVEALDALASEGFDLVFMDVAMPGLNGLETLDRIGRKGYDVAVILMTAFGSEDIAVDALREGAADYVRKPFSGADLDAAIGRSVERLDLRRQNVLLQRRLASYAALMEQQSLTDELTGLPNRRGFDQTLDRLRQAARSGSTYAVLMIDVDHFKLVNDRYGHAVGDEVLRAIASGLGRRVRVTDVVARIGGDEFAVLLPRTETQDAVAVAETLRAAAQESPVPTPAGEVAVTISIGVADSSSGDEVFAHADAALYAAKTAGRDTVVARAG